jgi:hypothetical protein
MIAFALAFNVRAAVITTTVMAGPATLALAGMAAAMAAAVRAAAVRAAVFRGDGQRRVAKKKDQGQHRQEKRKTPPR